MQVYYVKTAGCGKAYIYGTLIKSWTPCLFKFQWQNLMLHDHLGPGLTSICSDNNIRFLKLFIKNIIVNMQSGKVSFGFSKLSDVPL